MIKPYFRCTGKRISEVTIMFSQNGFNVKFDNAFGSDKPNPEGYNVLFSDFDRVREYSKEINPEYLISEHRHLVILKDLIKDRLNCPISRGMREAYEDILNEIDNHIDLIDEDRD